MEDGSGQSHRCWAAGLPVTTLTCTADWPIQDGWVDVRRNTYISQGKFDKQKYHSCIMYNRHEIKRNLLQIALRVDGQQRAC